MFNLLTFTVRWDRMWRMSLVAGVAFALGYWCGHH